MARSKAAGAIVVHESQQVGNKAIVTNWTSDSLQFNQSVLASRKGPATPVPSWKMYENPFYEGIMAVASGCDATVSARKLAATFWGLQEHAKSLGSSQQSNPQTSQEYPPPSPSPAISDSSMISAKQPSTEPAIKSTDSNGKGVQTNRQVAALRAHVHRLLERRADNKDTQISSPIKQHHFGIETQRKDMTSPNISKEIKNVAVAGPTTPNELLKVLSRIRNLEVQNTSSTSLAAALRMELDHARTCVQELEVQHKAVRKEIENLQKRMAEEQANWRNKEQENIRSAIQEAREEVEEERKLKRRIESSNKKLVKELADANAALSKVAQDLDRERKARELMETVCDELAREIADDKAEVEELKRESAKVREEVEEERKMLKVAEVWREERVQMKLMEAQHELEDRAAALNNLRIELEDFLDSRRFDAADEPYNQQDIKEAESLCNAVALQLDKTPFVLGWKDDRPNLFKGNSQPVNSLVSSSRNHEADMSEILEDVDFSEEQKSRTKSSKHKGRTNLLENSKLNRSKSKSSKEETMRDHVGWEDANASEMKGNKLGMTLYENALNLDQSVCDSDSDDGDMTADVHPVFNEVELISEQPTVEEFSIGLDLQARSTNTSDVWKSISLVAEKTIEESTPYQEGMGPTSPSQVQISKPLVSSVPQPINLSSGAIIHQESWNPTDSRNPHITRGIKGSIEWSKNVRDTGLKTKLEKQQSRHGWKIIK